MGIHFKEYDSRAPLLLTSFSFHTFEAGFALRAQSSKPFRAALGQFRMILVFPGHSAAFQERQQFAPFDRRARSPPGMRSVRGALQSRQSQKAGRLAEGELA